MNRPDFSIASDYATLSFNGGFFYYGYEVSICLECNKRNTDEVCDEHEDAERDWCFTATFKGVEIIIPFSKLGCKDMFNVVDCLNTGIGWVLAKYELVLK